MSVDLNSSVNIRRLKAAVILLGAAILAAISALGVGFYREVAGLEKAARRIGEVNVDMPAGAEVLSMSASGDRLFLHLRLAGKTEEIWVLDPVTFERLGRITLGRILLNR
jgi:hypothetical protein